MSPPDAIVVGAGANGLTAAALLARAGRKVVLLERRAAVGGLTLGDPFHAGFGAVGPLHDAGGLRTAVVRELDLARHGLQLRERAPDLLALGAPGDGLLLAGDPQRAAEAIGRRNAADADGWRGYRAFVNGIRGVLTRYLDEPPLDPTDPDQLLSLRGLSRGLQLRRLGRRRMMELLRLPPMCVADWLDEWFDDPLLQAALALPAVAGTSLGPRSPGSNLNLLLHEAAAGPGPIGGAPALVEALERAARAHGVEIRTECRVAELLVDAAAVRGVRLDGGEELRAAVVAAACDARHALLELLPEVHSPFRLRRRMRAFRGRGTTAQLLLALARPPRFSAVPDAAPERIRICPDLDTLERAHDAIKYRGVADSPALEVHVASVTRPELAPAGQALLSVLVHFVPYDREPRWDDTARERLADRVIERLETHAPGLRDGLLARHVLVPPDLEATFATTGGHLHHGEHALDQRIVRPVPECSAYATPIAGLFLCGGSSHPGGELTCAPGRLGARAILAHGR